MSCGGIVIAGSICEKHLNRDKNNNFYLDKKLTIRVKNLKVNKLNYKTQKITNENLPKSLQEYFLVEENTGKHISLPTQDKLQGYYYDKDSKKHTCKIELLDRS